MGASLAVTQDISVARLIYIQIIVLAVDQLLKNAIRAWVSNYNRGFRWNVINHQCLPSTKLGSGA